MKKLLFIGLLVTMCNLASADTTDLFKSSYYSESLVFDKPKVELYNFSRVWMLESFDHVYSYSESGDYITFKVKTLGVFQTVKMTIKDNIIMVSFFSNPLPEHRPWVELFNVSYCKELEDFVNKN